MSERTILAVRRSSIDDTEIRTEPLPSLADGHVRLRVDHVAITANTVTYAQFGDLLAYWGFYPLDDEWGLVPAVGWATVTESVVEGIAPGTHVHGWFPMATSVDILATPAHDGFRDDGAHRAAHAPIYRSLVAADHDPLYTGAADEERHSLLRVLYLTGSLIQSFFADSRFASVEQSIVMSASSKTAIGYAFATRQARDAGAGGPASVIGVTGAANVEFVRSLDLYDSVTTYDAVAALPERPSVVVDMAGAGDAVAATHARLGDLIAHSMIVGKSHHDAPGATVSGGPQPELFFAPTVAEAVRAAAGADAYGRALAAGVSAFIADSHRWLTIERTAGPAGLQAAWSRALSGAVPPSVGMIVAPSS